MVYVAHGYEDDGKVPDGVLRFVTNKLQITKPTASKYFHIGERETFLRSLKIELPWTSCSKIVTKIDEDHEKEFRSAFGELKTEFKHNLEDISGRDIDNVIAVAVPSKELRDFREVMSKPNWTKFDQDGSVGHMSDVSVMDLQSLVSALTGKWNIKADKMNLELAQRFITAATPPKPEPKPEPEDEDKTGSDSAKVNVTNPPEGPDVTITKTEPSAEQIQEHLDSDTPENDVPDTFEVGYSEYLAQKLGTEKIVAFRHELFALLRKYNLSDSRKAMFE
jgi:hypothetical protein